MGSYKGPSVGYSPRQTKIDEAHVSALMEVAGRLPPPLVDKRTMAVIDGAHRLEAFRRLGRTEVQVLLFEGHDLEAVVTAIEANVKHGKPLSRSERQTAARLVLCRFPEWSDRRVGEVCGLSHTTIAAIRSLVVEAGQKVRVGRDGRTRHVDRSHRHIPTARVINDNSDLGVPRPARATDTSPSATNRVVATTPPSQANLGEGSLRLGVVPELEEETNRPDGTAPRLSDVTSGSPGRQYPLMT